jgi:hypothetical protein
VITISDNSVIRLHPLERQALDQLLALTDEGLSGTDLEILKDQLRHAIILSREMTGHGFYTTFLVDESAMRLPNRQSLWFGAVAADVPGLEHGAGCQLYIKDGAVNQLEGFSYDGAWPDPWPGSYDESQNYGVLQIPRFKDRTYPDDN